MNNHFGASNKDNLTDVVEVLPQNAPAPVPTLVSTPTNTGGNNNSGSTSVPQERPAQQVVASDGNIITLGHNPHKKHKGNSLELNVVVDNPTDEKIELGHDIHAHIDNLVNIIKKQKEQKKEVLEWMVKKNKK